MLCSRMLVSNQAQFFVSFFFKWQICIAENNSSSRTLTKLELIFCRICNIYSIEKIEFSVSKISRVRDHILYNCTQSIRDYVAR